MVAIKNKTCHFEFQYKYNITNPTHWGNDMTSPAQEEYNVTILIH